MSGYFGQDYFGGRSFPASEGGPTYTLVVHLDAGVAASGTATQTTDALIVWNLTDASLASVNTDAALVSATSDAAGFYWLVSP